MLVWLGGIEKRWYLNMRYAIWLIHVLEPEPISHPTLLPRNHPCLPARIAPDRFDLRRPLD